MIKFLQVLLLNLICMINVHAAAQTATSADAKKYTAVIFDVDGVLVDTEKQKFEAWQEALSEQGVAFELEDYYPLVGMSSKDILKAINEKKHTTLGQEVIESRKAIYQTKQAAGISPFINAVAFLKEVIELKKLGRVKLALASSAPMKELLENVKQMGLKTDDFDFIASGSDSLKHIKDPTGVNKPKPYIYQLCAEKLKEISSNCIVFEDTNAGVVAAAEAGMDVIAVPNEFTREQDFSRALKVTSFESLRVADLVNTD